MKVEEVTDDEKTSFAEAYFGEEEEAFGCITALSDPSIQVRNDALSRLRDIFDKYLECPTLLDPSLESLVQRLSQSVREVLGSQEGSTAASSVLEVRHALSALYSLSKVRGQKIIQKFLPHGVDDVEPVWNALVNNLEANENEPSSLAEASPRWESIYLLWNWMAVLSLVPFDYTVLADERLVPSLIEAAKLALSEAGPIREAAASCLASWLSRPDLEQNELPAFVEWSKEVAEQYTRNRGSNSELFRVLGILQTLTTILKQSSVQRERLVYQMGPLWTTFLTLAELAGDNLLLRKLLIKWWTRMGCAFLPPRVAPWRYHRGKRSLVDNLKTHPEGHDSSAQNETESSIVNYHYMEELFFVPDEVEDAMGRLIEALGHTSTIVRWSAAKGVGRITERLPAVCAEDVLDAILDYFDDIEKDRCWHGACLALAELARRGLLLPGRLEDVVPNIVRAVEYDVRRGHTSVGAHVRDAACYCYWAFARAYNPSVLRPYLKELSEAIVLTSLFDREVNCRRAASAAFQEAVGRQGAKNFPHGIAILTTADFFSLGNRKEAYTSIALAVAKFDEYRRPIIRHVYKSKLFHWDIRIRELASKSLSVLAPLDPSYIGGIVLPFLMQRSQDPKYLHVRHGAVLGVAETILALAEINQLQSCISDSDMAMLIALVPTIEKKRLYRGRGGEIMRAAVCRLVECIAKANIPLTVRDQVRLLDSVDASIPHPSESIQETACRALQQLMTTYFPIGENGPTNRLQARVVDKFVDTVSTSENPAATRGYALALGFLPAKLLAPNKMVLSSVLECLRKAARHDSLVGGESDAETRRNALLAITRIAQTVGIGPQHRMGYPLEGLNTDEVIGLFDSFLFALEDYKSDRRGDVGSWSRLAAMDGLISLLFLSVPSCDTDAATLDSETTNRLIAALLKQLAENLGTVRQRAGECLEKILLAEESFFWDIAFKSELIMALGLTSTESNHIHWSDPSFTFPRVMNVASIQEAVFFDSVVAGIAISIGCLTDSVSKSASSAMLEWAKLAKHTERIDHLGRRLLSLLSNNCDGRVLRPVLKTLTLLFSHKCLDELMQPDSDFADRCLRTLVATEKGCNDVHRLLALVDLTAAFVNTLLQGQEDVKRRALAFLCKTLNHRFPRVRSHVAEQFYIVILEHPDLLDGDDESIVDVILNTRWSADLPDRAKITEDVAQSLGIFQEFKAIQV